MGATVASIAPVVGCIAAGGAVASGASVGCCIASVGCIAAGVSVAAAAVGSAPPVSLGWVGVAGSCWPQAKAAVKASRIAAPAIYLVNRLIGK